MLPGYYSQEHLGGRWWRQEDDRPLLSWPRALRKVRAWLEPWILLQRYWHAWSTLPPPLPLQQLLDALLWGSRSSFTTLPNPRQQSTDSIIADDMSA
jgi:hypothetical protein